MKFATTASALSFLGGIALAQFCGEEGGTILFKYDGGYEPEDFKDCDTIFGDILVDPNYVYVILDNVTEITGTIIAHDNQILKYVSLPSVQSVGGFSYRNPRYVLPLQFPEVTHIGLLDWQDVVTDSSYSFNWIAPKLTSVSTLTIERTNIPTLRRRDGGDRLSSSDNLEFLVSADSIRIVGNMGMDAVALISLQTVSGAIVVGDNYNWALGTGKKAKKRQEVDPTTLVNFPALGSAGSIDIYLAFLRHGDWLNARIDLGSLEVVSGDFSLKKSIIKELSVPELTTIEGDLKISETYALQNLDFPSLRSVANVRLDAKDSGWMQGIPNTFETISFPVLEQVGSFYVDSGSSDLDCSTLDHIREIAREFSCNGSGSTPAPPTNSTSQPSPGSESLDPTPATDPSPATSASSDSTQLPPTQTSIESGQNQPTTPDPTSSTESEQNQSMTPDPPKEEQDNPQQGSASSLGGSALGLVVSIGFWVLL